MELRTRMRKPKGRRAGEFPPARQLEPAEARQLDHAPEHVRRTLYWIVEYRTRHGRGPSAASVWSMFVFGHPHRRPDPNQRREALRIRPARHPGGQPRVRRERMPEPAHVRYVLWLLYDYGVRWNPQAAGSVRLIRHHHAYLRPRVLEQMTATGTWPRRRRYRGATVPL